jgi:hypothetical protein
LGNEWVGPSHESDEKGIVAHSSSWIDKQCKERGLKVKKLEKDNFGGQIWLRIEY